MSINQANKRGMALGENLKIYQLVCGIEKMTWKWSDLQS